MKTELTRSGNLVLPDSDFTHKVFDSSKIYSLKIERSIVNDKITISHFLFIPNLPICKYREFFQKI